MGKDTFSYHVTKYFSDYLPVQVAASGNTIRSYKDAFIQLFDFLKERYGLDPGSLTYSDFTSERIEEFLAYLEKSRGIGIASRNQRLAAIHAFFRYLQYREPSGFEQCSRILSVPFKKAPVATMSYMSIEEVKYLLTLPDQGTPSGLRDLAILSAMYETGARVQEIIDLVPASIKYGKIVTVELHGKGNKSRVVPIDASVAAVIKNYVRCHDRSVPTEPLFINRQGGRLTRAGIQYIIDKYIKIARNNKPEYFKQKISNHSFRHSKAMHMLEAGINLIYIRDFLGHTSVVTTEVYARTNPKIKEEQIRAHSQKITNARRYSNKQKKDLLEWLKSSL